MGILNTLLENIIKRRLDEKYLYIRIKNSLNVPQKEILSKSLKTWTSKNLKKDKFITKWSL